MFLFRSSEGDVVMAVYFDNPWSMKILFIIDLGFTRLSIIDRKMKMAFNIDVKNENDLGQNVVNFIFGCA